MMLNSSSFSPATALGFSLSPTLAPHSHLHEHTPRYSHTSCIGHSMCVSALPRYRSCELWMTHTTAHVGQPCMRDLKSGILHLHTC